VNKEQLEEMVDDTLANIIGPAMLLLALGNGVLALLAAGMAIRALFPGTRDDPLEDIMLAQDPFLRAAVWCALGVAAIKRGERNKPKLEYLDPKQ
jgi:hypothetical protein